MILCICHVVGNQAPQNYRPLNESSSGFTFRDEWAVVDIVPDVKEDPTKEVVKTDLPWRARYEWVSQTMTEQFSLFRWCRLLDSWLWCICVFERNASLNTGSLERVSVVKSVYHGREQFKENFFYMYMCHFSQLHVWLPFDYFTKGVLHLLNIAPIQLHPNSWGYLQAFWLLCWSLYLHPSP